MIKTDQDRSVSVSASGNGGLNQSIEMSPGGTLIVGGEHDRKSLRVWTERV
jgi:hypothetical protein